jgi:putative nucleotidyltransferase with HDIG domain
MTETPMTPNPKELYLDLCLNFFGALRALNLYTENHPEASKKIGTFYQKLDRHLAQKPTMTWLFIGREAVIENQPLPELETVLGKILPMLAKIKLERLTFLQGVSVEELTAFLRLLLPLMKESSGGEMMLSRNQGKLPHILAGRLPLNSQDQVTFDSVAGALQSARQAVLAYTAELKQLLGDIRGPLSPPKVMKAKEMTEAVHRMVQKGDLTFKLLIYRRSTDPDLCIHALNVSALSMAMAAQVKLDAPVIKEIGLGALLHDIGLSHAPSDLFSTGGMTLDEKNRYWEHPVRGAELLIASPGMPDIAPIIAYEHHIAHNGTGFPVKRNPGTVNFGSMITGIADSYDNLRRNRQDKDALSLTEALNHMDRKINETFHPLLLKKFRSMVKAQALTQ